MTSSDETIASRPTSDLSLTNWPLVQDGWRSLFYVTLTLSAAAVTVYVSGSRLSAALATLAIVISSWRFWLPVRFRFSYSGIIQTCLGRQRLIPWWSIRRCESLEHGVLLYFTADRSILAYLSTLFIDWRDQQDEVLSRIESFTRPANSGSRKSTEPHRA